MDLAIARYSFKQSSKINYYLNTGVVEPDQLLEPARGLEARRGYRTLPDGDATDGGERESGSVDEKVQPKLSRDVTRGARGDSNLTEEPEAERHDSVLSKYHPALWGYIKGNMNVLFIGCTNYKCIHPDSSETVQ